MRPKHTCSPSSRLTVPRIIDDIAAIQDQLVDLVAGASFERFTAEVRGIAEALDADGGHNPRDDDATNELHLDVLPDGTIINGTLVGDIEASITTALDAETDRLFREFTTDHDNSGGAIEIPKRSTLRAMALAELCRKGRAVDAATSKAPVPDVTLVINADDPFTAFTTDGRRLADAAAAVLCCDPAIHTLLINSLGVPLDLGTEVRYANRDQRRALYQRDGGCVFPGCGAHTNWCDAHHVIAWKPDGTGGPTDLPNLALMCRRHHRITEQASMCALRPKDTDDPNVRRAGGCWARASRGAPTGRSPGGEAQSSGRPALRRGSDAVDTWDT